jgi:hypothetical protein
MDANGFAFVDQRLTGSASAGGSPSYGLSLHQNSDGHGQNLSFWLNTSQGNYSYTAQAALASIQYTDWGAVYQFNGTFKLTSGDQQMPQGGSYVSRVAVSRSDDRVVSASFALTSSS